eukprot:TRINITY_DN4179_c0_g1_i1.p1 TRINITY_DN4179_c0_g1~~TRINITY_DN4179_c0_g1_i1.p1  ORF type:complete len:460 (-),score=147.59 TRINITY_DN4179_c0_g1_i1:760-2139(-)
MNLQALLLGFFLAGFVAADDLLVETKTGLVRGVYEHYASNPIRVFKGIPYGAPPTGDYRFSPPRPAQSWAPSVLDASSFGPGCPQNCQLPPMMCPAATSEDCLHVNVFAPLNASNLPVMVFIFGGGFLQGSASDNVYDGSLLADRGVIVVTADYRVDVIGWLVTAGSPGNYGLQDQRMYIQWAIDNIAAFGGNPEAITLFGESAGGMSIAAHLVSPLSAGMFQKVIIESDPFAIEFKGIEYATELGNKVAAKVGCPASLGAQPQLTCLRKVSIETLLAASDSTVAIPNLLSFNLSIALPWMPVVDGVELPLPAFEAFEQGKFQKVPMMLGTNQDEGIMFTYQIEDYFDNVEYAALLLAVFKESGPAVLEMYPPPADPTTNVIDLFSDLLTHYLFACSSRYIANKTASYDVPVYLYHFDHVLSFSEAWGSNFTFCYNKSCHGAEVVSTNAMPSICFVCVM